MAFIDSTTKGPIQQMILMQVLIVSCVQWLNVRICKRTFLLAH